MADPGQTAAGVATLPTGGVVYSSGKQYSAQPGGTFQQNLQDPIGATLSNAEGRIPSYSYATLGYTGYVTATDILCIIGSATTIVRLRRIAISGRATAATNIDVALWKRTVLNTGGTPTAITPVLHDTVINPAATAVVQTYVSAPTISGTGILMRAQQSNVSAAGAGGAAVPVEFDFGQSGAQSAVLRSATESYCLSLGGAAIPTGLVLNLWAELTEE
jgi:hypothetical protein